MEFREAQSNDLEELLTLYTHLHENPMPTVDDALQALWAGILADPNHHILLGLADDALISSCVLLIVPNLTRGQRPYGLIENVITHPAHRGQGYASRLLHFARELAAQEHCYKLMLMTGSKAERTLGLYERAGFNRVDKTAFVQWL